MKWFKTVPVLNPDGSVLLHDMYVNGEWIGSRRTLEQCEEVFRGPPHHGDGRSSGVASPTAHRQRNTAAEKVQE